jgi:hypothetical protein
MNVKKKNVEKWWNNTDEGKWKYCEKPLPMPICPPHTSHGIKLRFNLCVLHQVSV